jgi:hypothetical protein
VTAVLLAVIGTLAASLVVTTTAERVVCVGGIPLEKLILDHPLVFEGEVIEVPGEIVLTSGDPASGEAHWNGLRVRFRVDKVWKGDPGGTFIVWAYQWLGRWQTNDCAPTVERPLAGHDMLAFLDRLKR